MTTQTVGWVVLTNEIKDGPPKWMPDWDGEVHTDLERAETELAGCRADGRQCLLGVVVRYDVEDLAHRAAVPDSILSVRPPQAPDGEDLYAAELRYCLDFTITGEHLLLLGRLNWRWNGALDEHWWGGPAVSQRRPFGDEDMFGNIAELVDRAAWVAARESDDFEAYRAANEARFRRLHAEMVLVLEIVCSTGQHRSGRFIRASVLDIWRPAPEATFSEGRWNPSYAQDGFFTSDAWLPAADLVALVVNLGTKSGTVYEATRVVGTGSGDLIIHGGRKGWPHQPDREPEPVSDERIPVTEIARGFIHAFEGRPRD